MIRWNAMLELCAHLRAGLLDGRRRGRPRDVLWERLVELGGQHVVTPALAWCLQRRPDLPAPVEDYFRRILTLNEERNRRVLDSLADIAGALNGAGIEPILLKGASRLVEECYPAISVRFLGDIDVLVPAEAAREAVRALETAGYEEVDGPKAPDGHHHLPALSLRGVGTSVELHTEVVSAAGAAVLATDWFVRGTFPCEFRGRRVKLADMTRSIAHIVVHDQLQHGLHLGDRIELRQLLDVAILCRRSGDSIDWGEIDGRFRSAGHGHVLANYMKLGHFLLGQEQPSLESGVLPGQAKRFIRALDPAGMRVRSTATLQVDPAAIQPEIGHCWTVTLPSRFCRGDSSSSVCRSVLDIWEDEQPLGPAHSQHAVIRTRGGGAFSHWENYLHFSTSDNSDPRYSGRRYTIRAAVDDHIPP